MTIKSNEKQVKEALLATVRKVAGLYKTTEPLTDEYLIGIGRFLYALHEQDEQLVKDTVAYLIKEHNNPFVPRLSDYINAATTCVKKTFATADEASAELFRRIVHNIEDAHDYYESSQPIKAGVAALGGWYAFRGSNFSATDQRVFDNAYNASLDRCAKEAIAVAIDRVADYALEDYLEL